MIALISGTSGSGKTYIVQQILAELGPAQGALTLGPRDKHAGYIWPEVCIMGEYTTACGGCDRLAWKGAADEIERAVGEQVTAGRRVLLEGLLVGTWGVARMSRMVSLGLINIHLSTPVEMCVSAVESRRAQRAVERGKELTPFNPDNTVGKHRGLLSVLPARRAAGVPVEELDRAAALVRVRELILG